MIMERRIFGAFFILCVWSQSVTQAFVIAPPWANTVTNPCSKKSWQLLFWPPNQKCYKIFEQGPCPESQELGFNPLNNIAECRCPKDLLYWPPTDGCYPSYERGPCQVNQFLERNSITNKVQCKNVKRCENGWIYWPTQNRCFELYTQGPCHKGDLLIVNPLTAEPYCGCDPLLLRQYYSPPVKLCYEHFTKGPCELGLLFAYNHTSDSTHCMCTKSLVNYHEPSQRCYQFGSKGPCNNGQVFQLNKTTGRSHCVCKDNYVLWPKSDQCFKAFTPGPCAKNEFIVPSEDDDESIGRCVQNPCPRAHLYFPEEDGQAVKCHKVGSQGPCELGELVVFEKYSGKSYRGECGCSPGYNQNYWPTTGKCYEWYTRGPCQQSFQFQFNKMSGITECVCDTEGGYVYWNETKKCYRVYTQGPCPNNAWLIPGEADELDVFCECMDGYMFNPRTYTCVPTPILTVRYPGSNPTNKRPLEWTQGVFVESGERHLPKFDERVDEDEDNTRSNEKVSENSSSHEERLRERLKKLREEIFSKSRNKSIENGWGAQALPRIGRRRRRY